MSIRYKPEPDLFYKTVTERVDAFFNNNQRSRQANALFYLKALKLKMAAILLISSYSLCYYAILTCSKATKNPLLNLLFGGFNHHVTHHLFLSICHIHYPKLTPIIAQTCQEFGLEYRHESSFLNAYFAHYRLLKNNGTPLSLTDL